MCGIINSMESTTTTFLTPTEENKQLKEQIQEMKKEEEIENRQKNGSKSIDFEFDFAMCHGPYCCC